ncbi:MAG: allantoinase AllB [Thermomicrobiales bacterium]
MADADLIIENGTIVMEGGSFSAALIVANGQVIAYAENASDWDAPERIDADGLLVMPGGIDVHTHFEEPDPNLLEGFTSGGRAAAAGGLTTVVEMPQARPTTTTPAQFAEKVKLVNEHAVVDMALWAGAIGPPQQRTDDLTAMADLGAAAFKSFMASSSPLFPAVDTAQMLWVMEEAAALGIPYGLHAEDQSLLQAGLARTQGAGRRDPLAHAESRPPIVETVAVSTVLLLAAETGCHAHICHLASAGALELVRDAKARGRHVTAETCPQYLMLNTGDLERLAGFARCAPAIRPQAEVDRLWEGVLDGAIDLICSDHCPYTIESKETGYQNIFDAPLGLSGVQTLYPAMYSEAVVRRGLPPERFVQLLSTNPARIFGLYPRKGSLTIGADADITLLDPAATWTVTVEDALHRHKWTPYAGKQITGRVTRTIRRGETIFNDSLEGEGRILAAAGSGVYLPRGYGELPA